MSLSISREKIQDQQENGAEKQTSIWHKQSESFNNRVCHEGRQLTPCPIATQTEAK